MLPFWWNNLTLLEWQRRWLLHRSVSGPLNSFLQHPMPKRDALISTLDFMALDLETTGLFAKRDEILSIGMVQIQGCRIHLNTASHMLVRPQQAIPEESAIIHGVTDDMSRTGKRLESVLPMVLDALKGKVLIAHYARLEITFLQAACRRIYGYPLVLPVVDTLRMESTRLKHSNRYAKAGDLRLDALRASYSLPRYRAHNALSDALGAGELFLAMIAHRAGSGEMLTLGEVMR
ncbi:MAG: 3'-5' exonuclease [Magnetococcales bacterium]|nr:3'-5' exonuclease [Magnetococcales bacterium]